MVGRGTDDHIYFQQFTLTNCVIAWSSWSSVPGNGVTYSEPSIVQIPSDNRIHLSVVGTDNALYFQDYFLASGFSGFWSHPNLFASGAALGKMFATPTAYTVRAGSGQAEMVLSVDNTRRPRLFLTQ